MNDSRALLVLKDENRTEPTGHVIQLSDPLPAGHPGPGVDTLLTLERSDVAHLAVFDMGTCVTWCLDLGIDLPLPHERVETGVPTGLVLEMQEPCLGPFEDTCRCRGRDRHLVCGLIGPQDVDLVQRAGIVPQSAERDDGVAFCPVGIHLPARELDADLDAVIAHLGRRERTFFEHHIFWEEEVELLADDEVVERSVPESDVAALVVAVLEVSPALLLRRRRRCSGLLGERRGGEER